MKKKFTKEFWKTDKKRWGEYLKNKRKGDIECECIGCSNNERCTKEIRIDKTI